MAIDVLVFGDLAVRADLIEAIQKMPEGTRVVLTTGREYEVKDGFEAVIQAMRSMQQPAPVPAPQSRFPGRHSA